MPAPSRRPKTPAGTAGKAQGGLPLGNPVCLWQTELFKLNLKSSPSSSGYNRRRRLATRRCDTKRAGTTAVVPATIEWQQCLLHLHFFDILSRAPKDVLPERWEGVGGIVEKPRQAFRRALRSVDGTCAGRQICPACLPAETRLFPFPADRKNGAQHSAASRLTLTLRSAGPRWGVSWPPCWPGTGRK